MRRTVDRFKLLPEIQFIKRCEAGRVGRAGRGPKAIESPCANIWKSSHERIGHCPASGWNIWHLQLFYSCFPNSRGGRGQTLCPGGMQNISPLTLRLG